MKTQFFYRFVIALMLITAAGNLAAQDFKGGTVTYQQTTRYDFESIFGKFENPEYNHWVASLPRQNQSVKLLHFTQEKALFRQDPSGIENSNKPLQQGLQKASYFQPPKTLLLQVYSDFTQNEAIRQVEFMTRYFLIPGPIEKKAWKLTSKRLKIQDYVCTAAEMTQGEDQITAWFTSEIPVSVGPADYSGLPGLIMALEINGETAFLATSIDLTPPEEGVMFKPENGRKVTQEEFDNIMEEKTQEWRDTRKKGKKGRN